MGCDSDGYQLVRFIVLKAVEAILLGLDTLIDLWCPNVKLFEVRASIHAG